MGWEGDRPWEKTITDLLGNGENLNGRISFQGPYLVHGPFGLVFPASAALARDPDDDGRIRRLSPGRRRQCDLGCVRLAVPPDESPNVKALSGAWLTRTGMQSFLNGGAPDKRDVYGRDAEGDDITQTLFAREVRIGLARNAVTRVAEQGALYTAGFVRPRANEKIALVLGVSGENLPPPASPIAFGGEGRFAWVEPTNEIDSPKPPTTFHRHTSQNGEMLLYTVTLITPAKLPDPWPGPGDALDGLPGEIVCACHERPLMVGGWASQAVNGNKRGPQPLHAMLPAGSTWFLKAPTSVTEDDIRGRHLTHIGAKKDWGYGQILIGTWNDEQGEKGGGDE
jgi:CRISPR-associated protein Cmr3